MGARTFASLPTTYRARGRLAVSAAPMASATSAGSMPSSSSIFFVLARSVEIICP